MDTGGYLQNNNTRGAFFLNHPTDTRLSVLSVCCDYEGTVHVSVCSVSCFVSGKWNEFPRQNLQILRILFPHPQYRRLFFINSKYSTRRALEIVFDSIIFDFGGKSGLGISIYPSTSGAPSSCEMFAAIILVSEASAIAPSNPSTFTSSTVRTTNFVRSFAEYTQHAILFCLYVMMFLIDRIVTAHICPKLSEYAL